MKISHICFCGPYIDDWGYQDNLLPYYLTKQGTENSVITAYDNFPPYLSKEKVAEIKSKGKEYTNNLIKIIRLPVQRITTSLVFVKGLYDKLKSSQPDIIFHHGLNCTSLVIVLLYTKRYNCKLFVDNHADEYNISHNKLWVLIYHKLIIRLVAKISCRYVIKFYGVSKGRCDFLKKYYNIPTSKIDLLPIGSDTLLAETIPSKQELRKKYSLTNDDRVIVTGGKMGIEKGTDKLIQAISELNQEGCSVKLIVFGKIEDSVTEKKILENDNVIRFGWCDRRQTLELLKLADIACWPVHHTTLIEDAVSVETPLILRKTMTTEHLIEENGFWLDNNIKEILLKFFSDSILEKKIILGCSKMRKKISYETISEQVLSDANNNI